jgi:hypothetical protein
VQKAERLTVAMMQVVTVTHSSETTDKYGIIYSLKAERHTVARSLHANTGEKPPQIN